MIIEYNFKAKPLIRDVFPNPLIAKSQLSIEDYKKSLHDAISGGLKRQAQLTKIIKAFQVSGLDEIQIAALNEQGLQFTGKEFIKIKELSL